MEPTPFQIGKKTIFLQKIQHSLHGFYITLAFIFSVNKDVIQVNDDKNIELLGRDLINIALEAGRSIG